MLLLLLVSFVILSSLVMMYMLLVTSWLIAPDRFPRIKPIEISETMYPVIRKAVCMIHRSDIENICGNDQLCAVLNIEIEGANYAMSDLSMLILILLRLGCITSGYV